MNQKNENVLFKTSQQQSSAKGNQYIPITITKEEHLKRNPIRRLNLISGPRSAFARLFPERYRQEEEEDFTQTQRSKSFRAIDQQSASDNDDDYPGDEVRRSRRVRFCNSEDHSLNTRAKSEPYLNQLYRPTPPLNKNINYGPDPEVVHRSNPDKVTYTQKIGVRYLKPPTPPPPGPILIREIQATPPNDPPPLVVSTTPPIPPRTPSPLIVREQPPIPPEHQPAKVITKTLPPPPAAPRRVIIKRMPPLPAKPRPVIIEKWLPYRRTTDRPILYQKAEIKQQTRPPQRNLVLQYEPPRVHIKQELHNFGCFPVDPNVYRSQHGSSLRSTQSIRRVLQEIGYNPDLITSTGYNTCYSSQYDHPRQTTTCFTDEQLDALIGSARSPEHHYDVPRIYDENDQYASRLSTTV